jgi:hypothetical protein
MSRFTTRSGAFGSWSANSLKKGAPNRRRTPGILPSSRAA